MTETKSKLSLSDAGVSYAQKILDEMEKESDRATAILLGAELDDIRVAQTFLSAGSRDIPVPCF